MEIAVIGFFRSFHHVEIEEHTDALVKRGGMFRLKERMEAAEQNEPDDENVIEDDSDTIDWHKAGLQMDRWYNDEVRRNAIKDGRFGREIDRKRARRAKLDFQRNLFNEEREEALRLDEKRCDELEYLERFAAYSPEEEQDENPTLKDQMLAYDAQLYGHYDERYVDDLFDDYDGCDARDDEINPPINYGDDRGDLYERDLEVLRLEQLDAEYDAEKARQESKEHAHDEYAKIFDKHRRAKGVHGLREIRSAWAPPSISFLDL